MLFGGDFQSEVYENGGGIDMKYYVIDVKDGKVVSKGFVTEEEAKVEKFEIFEKTNNFFLSQKKMSKKDADELSEKQYANGGYFQSGVYAEGGSLEAHGIKEGDTFLKTISGAIQKVKDKNGNIVYINLENGERDSQPPLPFNRGGSITNERKHVNKGEDYEVRYAKPRPTRKGYKGLRSFDEGGNIDLTDDNKLKLRKPAMPDRKLSEAEWMAKHNASKEARSYGFGGLFNKPSMVSKPKHIDLDDKQVALKSGEYVQVLNQNGSSLMVMEVNKLGTGAKPRMVTISDVDMTSFKNGGALIGNQKRIDMNKNGKIDAEDFKLLRSSMNGAWRNERKHVNHNEDYEVRYAKPRPNRTGYKGKRKFEGGGGISNFERLSRVVAKNYEGKRVKPQYQKEYGKVYSKSEAKEVGNKVAGKMKTMKKAESGASVKKGGVMTLAKQIRKDEESWQDALKRAGQQLK